MRFTLHLPIEASRKAVWRSFTDRSRLAAWQSTLQAVEPVSGNSGEIGAVTKVTYLEGGRLVVMMETVTSRVENTEYTCSYAADLSDAIIRNRFTDGTGGSTEWTCEVELHFKGLLRFLAPLIKPMARKKTGADMVRFRALVEGGASGDGVAQRS